MKTSVFSINGSNYIIFQNNNKVIISEDDFVHYLRKDTDDITFRIGVFENNTLTFKNVQYKVDDLIKNSTLIPEKDFVKYSPYFGIKSRVLDNYSMLKESFRHHLNVINFQFPVWKKNN